MTFITQASLRYVQELGTFLGPQNRTQGRCDSHLHDIKWTCSSKCSIFSVALYFHPIDGLCCGEGVTILIFMYHVLCSSLCNFKYATFKVDDKVCDKIANLYRDM